MEYLADIHTKIVHFPIAFLMLYPIIEFLFFITKNQFFNKAGFLFLAIGVISAFMAVLSGNLAFEIINDWSVNSREVFNSHQYYANITIWYFTALLALKFYISIKKKFNRTSVVIFILLSLIGSYFAFQTGYYGGKFAHRNVISKTLSNENLN